MYANFPQHHGVQTPDTPVRCSERMRSAGELWSHTTRRQRGSGWRGACTQGRSVPSLALQTTPRAALGAAGAAPGRVLMEHVPPAAPKLDEAFFAASQRYVSSVLCLYPWQSPTPTSPISDRLTMLLGATRARAFEEGTHR